MVANFWLRSGNAYTSNNFQGFLADTIEKLNGKKIGLFRRDSDFMERRFLIIWKKMKAVGNYIIAARQYKPIPQIARHNLWIKEGNRDLVKPFIKARYGISKEGRDGASINYRTTQCHG
jgi:hypothetical protein